MAAAQALDFRDYRFGAGVTKAREVVRRYVAFLEVDRPLYDDHNNMKALVKSHEILEEVENTIGKLG
jgi:histidine ammonia-lyase